MSIVRFGGLYRPECDYCEDAVLPAELTFEDAVRAMNRAGWETRMIPKTKYRLNVCRECLEEEMYGTQKQEQQGI